MNNSQIDNVKLELLPNSELKADAYSVSPSIAKPNVGGSMVYLMDCVAGMKEYPDKYFDLAIVDPPYGIGAAIGFGRSQRTSNKIVKGDWDANVPTEEYFIELFRVSKNQVIWGGNYFDLNPTRCFFIWDKVNAGRDFADCEQAWTSFDKVARIFKYRVATDHKERFHPTQKPIKLYEWILSNYAEKGQRILDTHLGSGSSRIAADKYGMDFTGFEVNETYYNLSEKRFMQYKSQPSLFEVW